MILRMTFVRLRPEKKEAARKLYNEEVIPAHRNHKGIRYVHLLESMDDEHEGVTVTSWDSIQDAQAYERSGDYGKLVSKFKGLIEGEPLLKTYQVTASSEPLILRIF